MKTTNVIPPPERVDPAPRVRLGWLLAIILAGQFMAVLDVTIVNVAAPTLRQDLNASGAGIQMIIAGYTIAYAVLLITGARLGGRAGHRRMFQTGLAVFTLASLACGIAWSPGWLIGFRILQGAGAAMLVPQVLSLMQINFTGAARARAFSVYAAVLAGAAVLGQVLGGVLVDADIFGTGWRPVFLVNVPAGIVLFVLGQRLLPADQGRSSRQLDLTGLVTLSVAVCLFVVPLVLGHEQDWPLWGWACLGLSAVTFGAFVLVERKLARTGRAPLISGLVLRARDMPVAVAILFACGATFAGFLFTMTLHLQAGLGDSPLRAGLTIVPAATAFALVSQTWQRVPARWHRPMVVAGLVLTACAFPGLGLVFRGGDHGGVLLVVMLALVGFGMGMAWVPAMPIGLTHVPPANAPDASGLLATALQLGQVVGIATVGTLFFEVAGSHPSKDAELATALGLGGANLFAAVAALSLLRPRRAI